jgi:hypothetical protein
LVILNDLGYAARPEQAMADFQNAVECANLTGGASVLGPLSSGCRP